MLLICGMGNKHIYFFAVALIYAASVSAQFKKIDTTAKLGDAGYRVSCNNKKDDENSLSISPVGFKGARPIYFNIKGKVSKIIVDDLNDDGYPDLLVLIYTGANNEIGNVVGITSNQNTDIMPVFFPDIYNDPKLREGYKGHDEFAVVVGTLLRTFPIYKPGDTDTPSGGKRVVQYKIDKGENGRLTFKMLRTYEKQE